MKYKASTPLYLHYTCEEVYTAPELVARKHTTTENIQKIVNGYCMHSVYIYLLDLMVCYGGCLTADARRRCRRATLPFTHAFVAFRSIHGTGQIQKRGWTFGIPRAPPTGFVTSGFSQLKRHGRQRANPVRARLFDLIIIIIIIAGIVSFLLYCSNDTDTVQIQYKTTALRASFFLVILNFSNDALEFITLVCIEASARTKCALLSIY